MFLFKSKKRRVKTVEERLVAHRNGVSIERIDYRCFYDSRWTVRTKDATYTVVRHDTETASNLLKEILTLPEITEVTIKSLDKHDKIYYD